MFIKKICSITNKKFIFRNILFIKIKLKLDYKLKFIIIIIILLLYVFLISLINKNYVNYFNLYNKKLTYKQRRYYDDYNKLKKKYSNNKFLKPYLDSISIISYDYSNLTKNNCYVHICMNLNEKYIYPTLVSMESALNNSNINTTTLIYHILCSDDLKKDTFTKIKSLLIKYPFNLEIIFYNMRNAFIKFKNQVHSQVTYYRLLTPIFLPIKKVIYLDSDVLIFKDLLELYQTPFNNNYVLGILDVISDAVDYLGLKSDKYINAGVLLINLDKLRKTNKFIDLIKMAENNSNLIHHDQTVINYLLYPYIGILPIKFGILNFQTILDIKEKYLKLIRQKINISELEKAFNDPYLIHLVLCFPKAWHQSSKYVGRYTMCKTLHNCNCTKYYNIWHEFAKKTAYYQEIIKNINNVN